MGPCRHLPGRVLLRLGRGMAAHNPSDGGPGRHGAPRAAPDAGRRVRLGCVLVTGSVRVTKSQKRPASAVMAKAGRLVLRWRAGLAGRSEERRVGKELREQWAAVIGVRMVLNVESSW